MPKLGMEPIRKAQLMAAAFECIHEYGFPGTTIARVSEKAGVSVGITSHYFGNKEGLLDATMRQLIKQLSTREVPEGIDPADAKSRILHIIDSNFAQQQVNPKAIVVWLAFWGHAIHVPSLTRLQRVNKVRLQSNLGWWLRKLLPVDRARFVAEGLAALIDGLWLRGALQAEGIDTRGGVFHSAASKIRADGRIVFCEPGDTDCGTFTADQPVGTNGFFSGGALFDAAGGRVDDGVGDELEGAYDRTDSGVDRETLNLTGILRTSIGDSLELVSVTDYTSSDKVYAEEDDSTRYNVVTYDATADIEQFSQELRISGASETMEWIAGAYYLYIQNDFSGAFAFPSDGYLPRFTGDSETNTISVIGQVDYNLTESLLLTAGLRWTRDDKDFVYQMVECDVASPLSFGFCPPFLITDPALRAEGEALLAAEPGIYDLTGFLVDGSSHPFDRKDEEIPARRRSTGGSPRTTWSTSASAGASRAAASIRPPMVSMPRISISWGSTRRS